MIRRVKSEVEEIPRLEETVVHVSMTSQQRELYRELIKVKAGEISEGGFKAVNNMDMELRKCCNHPLLIK